MNKVLFISVDGDQNYLESLFIPVLAEAKTSQVNIEILEFCLKDPALRKSISKSSIKHNIKVYFGRYFNYPPVIGSFLFLLISSFKLALVVKKRNISTLMPRSLMAGGMALITKFFNKKLRIIYEADGLMSDERVDFGNWKKTGIIYKLFQNIEAKLIKTSDLIIVRTDKTKSIFLNRSSNVNEGKIVTIPNGKDSKVFNRISTKIKNSIRYELGINKNDLVLIYVGSIGEQYLPHTMIKLFKIINDKYSAKFLILTPNLQEIKLVMDESNIKDNVIIRKVDPNLIGDYIAASDIGIALRQPFFSQQAVCPLKIIEYLMCGLPIITNSGIGDLDELFKNDVGYIINDLNNIDYNNILNFIKNVTNNRNKYSLNNRNLGVKNFDIKKIGLRYQKELLNL